MGEVENQEEKGLVDLQGSRMVVSGSSCSQDQDITNVEQRFPRHNTSKIMRYLFLGLLFF